jgi:uncharacterized protein (TIGR03437 family)
MRHLTTALLFSAALCIAASPNRIARPVDRGQTHVIAGGVHRLAQRQFDRGAIDADTPIDYVLLMVKPTANQKAELERVLADQQNPSSPEFRKWLTPEEFGNRFGLSASDHSKVVAWLESEGLRVRESARARNWVAFSGTAGQVSKALHTPIHRYEVDGQMRRANTADPSVPDALAEVIDGFVGLDDFVPTPDSKLVTPDSNSGASHFLAPEDFATIYNLAPLYKAGLDGTGQSIAIVGQSAVLLSDLRTFRTRYNLPASDPKMLLYNGVDPGFNSAQPEGNLDLEWAGAIAPKATLYYIYGASAFSAMLSAISSNIAPVISVSYGGCEIDFRPEFYRAMAQQANAQGITIVSSSGDAGAMGCDRQGSLVGTRGAVAHFPTVLPEITSVGGTQFAEGSGTYWASTNSVNLGSALSYIPEAVWNETSGINGLLAGGGGVSQLFTQPVWQRGPGIPVGGFRRYPDVSFTASAHDGYFITYFGSNAVISGTSASTPSMAGFLALLNQAQTAKGAPAGLGNINPQLYRLAQTAPTAFHDTVAGNNFTPCAQGTPDCMTGTIGAEAAPGHDLATGLGSIDADKLVSAWDTGVSGVSVGLVVSATRVAANDSVDATALVTSSKGTPTGRVDFSLSGVPIGSASLVPRGIEGQAADITFPAYLAGSTGTYTLIATYSGDTAFGSGGATKNITVTTGTGAAAIFVTAPASVWPAFPDGQGPGWQTQLSLREGAGVAAMVTGFAIDGQAQPLAAYFPSTNIPAGATVLVNVVFRNVATPAVRRFDFTGIDSLGNVWSRSASVSYLGLPSAVGFDLTATPLNVKRNSADPSCGWPVEVHVDELDGYGTTITGLWQGTISLASQIPAIFGTARLNPWGSLKGTLCFDGIVPPASSYIEVDAANGFVQQVLVSFAAAATLPAKVSASPAAISLSSAKGAQTLAVGLSDNKSWTASVFPKNRMAGWLSVSPRSGSGPAQLTVTANGAGYGPGAYNATIVIECADAAPHTMTVPVMFVIGNSSAGMSIASVGNAASGGSKGAPGMLLAIYGSGLAQAALPSTVVSPKPYTLGGVSATVNGIAAPVLYVSPGQVNIQIPFEVGAGPAVVGLNNSGQIAGFQFDMAPAAPGIFADGDGMVSPQASVEKGKLASLFLTGGGDVTPALTTGFSTSPTSSFAGGPKPALPLSITVGGILVFVQTAAVAPGQIGMMQVNYILPPSVPTGKQSLVVTIGGVASAPVGIMVQ